MGPGTWVDDSDVLPCGPKADQTAARAEINQVINEQNPLSTRGFLLEATTGIEPV